MATQVGASNRILEKILPQIYPGSIYGKRMPIGLMSVVKNFKPETLRGYYRRWHRPENQAVIVVGDFNPDIMEAKVKQMFSPLKAGNAKGGKAMLPKVPDNKKMIVAIGSDPEQGHNMLQLHFKHKAPSSPVKITGAARLARVFWAACSPSAWIHLSRQLIVRGSRWESASQTFFSAVANILLLCAAL